MVICLERGADLHMVQLMPLPLTVSCFSKLQIGFTILVPAHPGGPGQRAVKRVCVCVCMFLSSLRALAADIADDADDVSMLAFGNRVHFALSRDQRSGQPSRFSRSFRF